MHILRSFLALLAGFAAVAALLSVFTLALTKYAPRWAASRGRTRAGYVLLNLGSSLAAAAAGGYIAACIATDRTRVHATTIHVTMIHVFVLALIVLLLGALSALQQRGQHPIWHQLLLVAVLPIGVVLGGLLCLKFLGL